MSTRLFLASVVVMSTIGLVVAQPPPALVRVDTGQLQGVVDDDVMSFKGVPFAAPPVGELRWRPPQAPAEASCSSR